MSLMETLFVLCEVGTEILFIVEVKPNASKGKYDEMYSLIHIVHPCHLGL